MYINTLFDILLYSLTLKTSYVVASIITLILLTKKKRKKRHHMLLFISLLYVGPAMSPGLLPTSRRTHSAPPPLMPGNIIVNVYSNYSAVSYKVVSTSNPLMHGQFPDLMSPFLHQ